MPVFLPFQVCFWQNWGVKCDSGMILGGHVPSYDETLAFLATPLFYGQHYGVFPVLPEEKVNWAGFQAKSPIYGPSGQVFEVPWRGWSGQTLLCIQDRQSLL